MSEPFRVVVSDPPWLFGDKLPGPGRGAVKHYPCMTPAELLVYLPGLEAAGEVLIDRDAVLFLWRVPAMGSLAYRVVDAWRFVEKAEMIWRKLTKHGKPHFGMGRSIRMSHEAAIIAHRGRPTRLSASVRSVFEAPVGKHSEKPEAFFDLVEKLYPGPYLELFARRRRPGWTCLGLELDERSAA